jgi:adenine-specific DNA-methyltransferase
MIVQIEDIRREVSSTLDKNRRSELGQFFTPQGIAGFMASLFQVNGSAEVKVLDAGAGIGSLISAFLEKLIDREARDVKVTAYEVDAQLAGILRKGLEAYKEFFEVEGKRLTADVIEKDFIEHAVIGLCTNQSEEFDYVILNPPYFKINSGSRHRRLLRKVRIETVNLYSAFVGLSLKLLAQGGQLVAIIPRSFCNGPYYKPFREQLLAEAAINQIHLFEARDKAFGEDGVLQENIILHLTKGAEQGLVRLSTSVGGDFSGYKEWAVPFEDIVRRDDPGLFIHIPDFEQEPVLMQSPQICFSLSELGLEVSTGPVVDFRLKDFLRKMPGPGTSPLIYPAHFGKWIVTHPLENFKKWNAIEAEAGTLKWLYPSGYYTLVRRFSSKEEKRRIVARTLRPEDVKGDMIGFENHLNVFHAGKQGLPEEIAFGLAVFLNSTAVDEYFRLFSGHTQVNATDLRLIKYPSFENLAKLGKWGKGQTGYDQD